MNTSTTGNERGFTLVELLIVMVVLSIVGAAFVRALTSASQVSQAQAEKSNMQANLRAGGGLLPAELREINFDPNTGSADLLGISKDSVRYRAMRRVGLACNAVGTAVTVRNTNSFGLSGYAIGDSLLLFVENVDSVMTDDDWAVRGVTAVGNGTCPDGERATLLTVDAAVPGGLQFDAPVRTFEDMTLRVYQADGRWWLGARSNGDAIQPVLGPLSNADSTFGFRTATGAATTTPASVRVIEATLHGETSNAISTSGYGTRQLNQDSLRIRIRLRNAP